MELYSLYIIVFLCLMTVTITVVTKLNRKNTRLLFQIILLLFNAIYIVALDYRFFLLILCYSFVIYIIGDNVLKHRLFLGLGIAISLSLLVLFKYLNFIVKNVSYIFGFDFSMFDIILPIGISFYSLSGICYLCDIYRKKISPERNFLVLLNYFCFFSKLAAGPIVRFSDYNEGLKRWNGISFQDISYGIQIFSIGIFKKMVLANRLGVFVDDFYGAPFAFSSGSAILAILSYSLQIYFDFSGYSDMAIGCAKILGLSFKRNFDFPYIASNLSDFWKRWHISLSSWFMDYLYIPLGGSRKGELRTCINLLIVMILSGLWHGAEWTFIIWGMLHGIGSIISRYIVKQRKLCSVFMKLITTLVTFFFVSFCWIFFRATSISNAFDVIKCIFSFRDGISQLYSWSIVASLILIAATIFNRVKNPEGYSDYSNYPFQNLKTFSGLLLFFIFVGLTIGMAYVGDISFIYRAF